MDEEYIKNYFEALRSLDTKPVESTDDDKYWKGRYGDE